VHVQLESCSAAIIDRRDLFKRHARTEIEAAENAAPVQRRSGSILLREEQSDLAQ
jgi:chaperonin cofactor prefoldin